MLRSHGLDKFCSIFLVLKLCLGTPVSSKLQFRKPFRSDTLHEMTRLSNQRFGGIGITNLEIGNEGE